LSYQILPNLILLLAILGVVVLVLRRLPEAASLDKEEAEAHTQPQLLMAAKGLPAKAASRSKAVLVVWFKKLANFILEAKGLRHAPTVNYKIKKIRRQQAQPAAQPVKAVHDEEFYLEQIKKFPKNLEYYNELGQYYIGRKEYTESRDVFDYLVKHSPANADYLARLGFSQLHIHEYREAVTSYNKALALDSSHPNRYYNLALAHSALAQRPDAATALRQAIKLESGNVKYMQLLSELYHQMGEGKKAREISRSMARMDTTSGPERAS
jgi:tetratricopeptide (TPR) repeat protein